MLQQLGRGADAKGCGVVQHIDGRLGVDQQGRNQAVVAGDRHVAVHDQFSLFR